jgi:hypothetical protein
MFLLNAKSIKKYVGPWGHPQGQMVALSNSAILPTQSFLGGQLAG